MSNLNCIASINDTFDTVTITVTSDGVKDVIFNLPVEAEYVSRRWGDPEFTKYPKDICLSGLESALANYYDKNVAEFLTRHIKEDILNEFKNCYGGTKSSCMASGYLSGPVPQHTTFTVNFEVTF